VLAFIKASKASGFLHIVILLWREFLRPVALAFLLVVVAEKVAAEKEMAVVEDQG